MVQKLKHYTKEILYFILFITIVSNTISFYKSTDLNKSKLENIQTKLINNIPYNSSIKKPLMVHFWATWCPVCKTEIDNIQRLSEHYEVISIAVNSGTNNDIHKYMKQRNLNFRVINDQDGKLAKRFNVTVYPTTFIYDKNKDLLFSEVGYTSTLGLLGRMWWASL